MEDYRQSEEYCRYYSKKGWTEKRVGSTRVLIKKILWLGSLIKIQRCSANTPLVELEKLAKKNRALLIVMEFDVTTGDACYAELEESLSLCGYKDLNLFFSPTKTTYIDLTKSEEIILSSFDQDIRKSLRRNLKKNISFRLVSHIEEFYSLLYEAGHRRNYFVQNLHDWKDKWGSFGNQVQVLLAYLDEKLLGGNMFIINPPIACGLFLPTTEYGRCNRIAATLVWEGLKLAKKSGCTLFDLDGISDERYKPKKNWRGITTFKRKFRGREVEFMHPKVKIYSRYLKPLERLGLFWMFFDDSWGG
ncbi:aminoacyltransferase [Patescibacteria group bacterium]|nr:aminoacyltransferase [Patescibacteria group bacterium]